MRERDPKDMIRDVLEHGEQLLWHGGPNIEAATQGRGRGRGGGKSFLVAAVAVVGFAYFRAQESGVPVLETLQALFDANPLALYGAASVMAILALAPLLGFDAQSRLKRHFAKPAYGLTDRRVIVIEGSHVSTFAGGELDRPTVVERAGGYDDVIFGRRVIHSSGDSQARDPVQRERRTIGFKAIPNAEEMRVRLDEWIAGEIAESAESVTDFIEAQEEVDPVGFAAPSGSATVRHADTGMTMDFPDEWSVKVRKKKKPFGKTFLDSEKWKELHDSYDWTLVRVEGPLGCTVDAEIFETRMLGDFDSMVNSRFALLAGELLDSDPQYEQNELRGFTVARRTPVLANAKTGAAGAASVVTPFRWTVLHDGRYQIVVTSKWPEASPELSAAVDLVVRSVRLA